MEKFELTVIGGGPGGYSAALRGAARGLKTLLVEKDRLGGTCLNHGCIPTKSLVHSASLYRKLQDAGAFGIRTGEVGFDYARIQPVSYTHLDVYKRQAEARVLFPRTPLYLGCMRPGGRHREELDCLALGIGINKIVRATAAARRLAVKMRLKVNYGKECCAL